MTNDSERVELLQTALLVVCSFLVCTALVCASCALDYFCSRPAPVEPDMPETCSVTWILPDGTQFRNTPAAAQVLSAAPDIDEPGYTLVAWRDGNGTDYSPALPTTEFRGEVTLTALLMPALETEQHIAYMPLPAELGMFSPDDVLTMLELADCAAALLSVEVKPTEYFTSSSSDLDTSYNVLKTLGALRGDRFDPSSAVLLRDLVSVFAAFFPQGPNRAFAGIGPDDPDYGAFCTAAARGWIDGGSTHTLDPSSTITRAEAARFINRVLGREPSSQDTDISGVFADVPLGHPYHDDIMEAAVVHTYRLSEGTEQWTWANTVPRRETGLYRDGTLLRCIDDDGYMVKDSEWNGFRFDKNGVYTCGMTELDVLVQDVLAELGTDEMEALDALRAVYNYTRDSFTYLRRNYYDTGATGWGEQEAYTMLSTGYGNCYCYAATFYELARALGFNARLISGTVGSSHSPHGWVEFDIDGARYVCDAELEMTYYRDRRPVKPDMFMMPDTMSSQWFYLR